MANDGSIGKPWRSLAEVIANNLIATSKYVNPSADVDHKGPTQAINVGAPIHAGDTIILLSGNHGTINLTGVNSDFITIAAGVGETPILNSLVVKAGSKWLFRGLKVQGLAFRLLRSYQRCLQFRWSN